MFTPSFVRLARFCFLGCEIRHQTSQKSTKSVARLTYSLLFKVKFLLSEKISTWIKIILFVDRALKSNKISIDAVDEISMDAIDKCQTH